MNQAVGLSYGRRQSRLAVGQRSRQLSMQRSHQVLVIAIHCTAAEAIVFVGYDRTFDATATLELL